MRAVNDLQPGSMGCAKGVAAVETVPPGKTPIAPPSARYAKANASDEENREHLKKELIKVDVDETQAFFVCVLVMLNTPSDPFPLVATGMLEGTIKITSEGMNGFGYDPMFYPLGSNLSLAQMPNEEKAKLSHRGKAAETLRQKIKNFVS